MIYLQEYRKCLDITMEEARRELVSFEVVMSKRRTEKVVLVRTRAISRIRKETTLSLTEIGYFFRRDHATVMHALKKEL